MIAVDLPRNIAIVPFAPWHLCALDPRGPDAASLRSLDRRQFGRELARDTQAQTALLDHLRPIACWGFAEVPARVLVGWCVTDVALDHPGLAFAFYKVSRRIIEAAMARAQRIEFNVLREHDQSCRWLAHLGFEREGLRRRFGPSGEDFWLYAKVTP